jgi:hypothetical protein
MPCSSPAVSSVWPVWVVSIVLSFLALGCLVVLGFLVVLGCLVVFGFLGCLVGFEARLASPVEKIYPAPARSRDGLFIGMPMSILIQSMANRPVLRNGTHQKVGVLATVCLFVSPRDCLVIWWQLT